MCDIAWHRWASQSYDTLATRSMRITPLFFALSFVESCMSKTLKPLVMLWNLTDTNTRINAAIIHRRYTFALHALFTVVECTLSTHEAHEIAVQPCVLSDILRWHEGPAGMSLPQILICVILPDIGEQAKAMIHLLPVQCAWHTCTLAYHLWNHVCLKGWSLSLCCETWLSPTQGLTQQ